MYIWSDHRSQIDCITISSRFKSSLLDVRFSFTLWLDGRLFSLMQLLTGLASFDTMCSARFIFGTRLSFISGKTILLIGRQTYLIAHWRIFMSIWPPRKVLLFLAQVKLSLSRSSQPSLRNTTLEECRLIQKTWRELKYILANRQIRRVDVVDRQRQPYMVRKRRVCIFICVKIYLMQIHPPLFIVKEKYSSILFSNLKRRV